MAEKVMDSAKRLNRQDVGQEGGRLRRRLFGPTELQEERFVVSHEVQSGPGRQEDTEDAEGPRGASLPTAGIVRLS